MENDLVKEGMKFISELGNTYILRNIRRRHLLELNSDFIIDLHYYKNNEYVTTFSVKKINENIKLGRWEVI